MAEDDYGYRHVSSYRMTEEILDRFLKGLFGDVDFYIEVRRLTSPGAKFAVLTFCKHLETDRYKFWISRDLTLVSARLSHTYC